MAIKNLEGRARRKRRIRKKVNGTPERPRLSVFRSAKHIYAQVVDDVDGKTLASASTVAKDLRGGLGEGNKSAAAKKVGALLAEQCKSKGITKVVFDRNGYLYHGRIKALADAAREAGLDF
jgi:large subunit ribosomal protein L18